MTEPPATAAVQRHVVRVLAAAQVLGSVGFAAGMAVGVLLARDVGGSETTAGLGGTAAVLGAALIAVPTAQIMSRFGRRPGLVFGYGLATLGALGLIASGIIDSFALLICASVLLGGAAAANNQSRYAAADLAAPAHRGRDLALVVWATTAGAVLGPNLTGPGAAIASTLGIPALTGPFTFAMLGFLAAALVLWFRLRPDPLLTARAIADDGAPGTATHGSVLRGFRTVGRNAQALTGLLTAALGHTVMVAVMVMTPIHMSHGQAELRIIGLVLSAHVFGMFAFSPLVGRAVDRYGGRAVALAGVVTLLVATGLAARAEPGHSARLTIGLILLGLGWSCTLVSGSTLLTAALPVAERPGAQGAADVAMGLAAGAAGGLSGVVVATWGYFTLATGAGAIAVALGIAVVGLGRGTGRQRRAAERVPSPR